MDEAEFGDQHDQAKWPSLTERMAAVFRGKTREEWRGILEGADLCYAPVLSMTDAPHHPHNAARKAFVELDGVLQPAPVPRFSRTPGAIQSGPAQPGAHNGSVFRDWGVDAPGL